MKLFGREIDVTHYIEVLEDAHRKNMAEEWSYTELLDFLKEELSEEEFTVFCMALLRTAKINDTHLDDLADDARQVRRRVEQ